MRALHGRASLWISTAATKAMMSDKKNELQQEINDLVTLCAFVINLELDIVAHKTKEASLGASATFDLVFFSGS